MFNKKLKEEILYLKKEIDILKQNQNNNERTIYRIGQVGAFYNLCGDHYEIPEEDINKQIFKYQISDNNNTIIQAERMVYNNGVIQFENSKRCVDKVYNNPYRGTETYKRDIWYLVASCSANLTVTKI